jgi:hypothetical protein
MKLDENEILKLLESIDEDTMTKDIIIPLYKKKFLNKYYEIEFTGGKKNSEQGCDIQYYEITLDTKAKEYSGIQVKQGNIDTSKNLNTGIASLSIQAQQAFQKPIHNIKDKVEYKIKTFIILTTGDVLPDARAQIVDQFSDKNIRFITGKDVSQWINNDYLDDFKKYFSIQTQNITLSKNISPTNLIIEYLKENYEIDCNTLYKSFRPFRYKKTIIEIIIYLLENSQSKIYNIAKELECNKDTIEEYLKELHDEELVESDEDGFYLNRSNFEEWKILKSVATERIKKLGYEKEVDVFKVLKEIIFE